MSVLSTLEAGLALIRDESRFWKGEYAITADGMEVCGSNPEAVCWCSEGALQYVLDDWEIESSDDGAGALRALSRAMGNTVVSMFNDNHTHAEVVAAWEAAIAAERKDA